MTAMICNAVENGVGCPNRPIPGHKSGLCDYHLDMEEDGIPFLRRAKRGRPRLNEPVAEKAAKFMGMRDRHMNLMRKRRGIKPQTPGELAAKLDLRRAKDRNRKHQSAKEAKAERVELIREGLAQRKQESA